MSETSRTSRIARAGFDVDLIDGEAKQDAFVRVLLRSKVEVKFDDYCAGRNGRTATGNLALEYAQRLNGELRPRASGIHQNSTKADWLAVEFAEDRWLVVPMNVAQALARRAKTEGRTRWIGDGGNHLCALVPFDWFRQ